MQIKRIKCPKCNVVLDVKNSKERPELLLNCPRCRTELLVKFPPREEPIEAPTFCDAKPKTNQSHQSVGSENFSFETQLGDTPFQSTSRERSKAKLPKLICNGETYVLSEGENVIGRRANTSLATIQIACTDRFMSRQHCIITITDKQDGTYKAVLSNYQNKNETSINGYKIDSGDAIVLNDGNTITMGHTAVTYSITPFHD